MLKIKNLVVDNFGTALLVLFVLILALVSVSLVIMISLGVMTDCERNHAMLEYIASIDLSILVLIVVPVVVIKALKGGYL